MKLWPLSLILAASALAADPVRGDHASSVVTRLDTPMPVLRVPRSTRPPPGAVWVVILGVCSVGAPALSPFVRTPPRSRERWRRRGVFRPMTRRTS
jgi:hypothetical protein